METTQQVALTNQPDALVETPKDLAVDPNVALESAKQAAKALLTVVSQKRQIVINGKRYLTFEDWQTIGRFYGVTVGVASTGKAEHGYEARAEVYDRQGTVISAAEAICTREERNWQDRDEYAIKSMAQTRACAKALRNVLAWVAVLAGFEGTPAEETEGIAEEAGKQGNGNSHNNGNAPVGKRADTVEQARDLVAPHCPVHQTPMRYRKGRYGDFWSCGQRKPDGRWCNVTYEVTKAGNGHIHATAV